MGEVRNAAARGPDASGIGSEQVAGALGVAFTVDEDDRRDTVRKAIWFRRFTPRTSAEVVIGYEATGETEAR